MSDDKRVKDAWKKYDACVKTMSKIPMIRPRQVAAQCRPSAKGTGWDGRGPDPRKK